MNEVVTIVLDRAQAVEFVGRLGLLEDWLMHTDDVVVDDLARFGFRHCYNPSLAITDLIRELGNYGVILRRGLDQTTTTQGDTPMNHHHTSTAVHTLPPASARLASPRAESGECLCHDATCCPHEATVTVSARDLVEVGELLCDLDEFLRSWTGVAELMAEFIRPRHDTPGMNASLLIDTVSFAAAHLRRHCARPDQPTQAGAQR